MRVKPHHRIKDSLRCDPSVCDSCQYIGEGDFVCDRYLNQPDKVMVVENWLSTENYLQCKREGRSRR